MTKSRLDDDTAGVSEVIGVVMMLAMIISVMAGVWVFLQPYIKDFEDNTKWSTATGLADRFEDRIDVVSASPEGTGVRQTLLVKSSYITPIMNVESWTISADLVGTEKISIEIQNVSAFSIQSMNNTPNWIFIQGENGSEMISINNTDELKMLNHSQWTNNFALFIVYDEDMNPIHQHFSVTLSGLKILTNMQGGTHEITLINEARTEKFPNDSREIKQQPVLKIDELVDGTIRCSIRLLDVSVNGSLAKGGTVSYDIISNGPETIFSDSAYNMRFTYISTLDDITTPQIHEIWLSDYIWNRASGTDDSFRGISPWERASGSDGFTVDSGNRIDLEVDFQSVVIET